MPRPRSTDLNSAVHAIVAQEIASALEPYRDMLARFEVFGRLRRGPGRPRAAGRTRASGRARPGRAPRGGRGRQWRARTRVHFKQGRGSFEGHVVRQDADTGLVTVQRVGDGEKFTRGPDSLRKARG